MPTTTNHGANLPSVGADFDEWGDENNAAHNFWDALTSGNTLTMLGRVAGGAGPYTQLTAAQITTIPNTFGADSGSGGLKGLAPATAAGDGAAKRYLTADGTWSNEVKAQGVFTGSTGATVSARNISISRSSAGLYIATFGTALANANYGVLSCLQGTADLIGNVSPAGKSATGFTFVVLNVGGVATDPTQLYLQVFGA